MEFPLSPVRFAFVCLLAAVLAPSACSRNSDTMTAQSAPPTAAGQASPVMAQAGQQDTTRAGVQTVSGTVVETMNAATYTYVRVKTPNGAIWAASMQFPVAVGDKVVVPLETPMQNFRSQSLNREFPLIYFASQITREGA